MARRVLSLIAVLALLASLGTPAAATSGSVDGQEPSNIVAGTPATPANYPWFAVFDSSVLCGTSLIAPSWILTAAHCVEKRNGGAIPASELAFRINPTALNDGSGERRQAQTIVIHPKYSAITNSNDIALVRLTAPSTKTPVSLADSDDLALNAEPTVATAIGFGTTRTDGPTSNQLLKVSLKVVDDTDGPGDADGNVECDDGYPGLIFATMVCAGQPSQDSNNPGPDTCQGDSGGPLFVGNPGAHIQFGVVSFGQECGVSVPGVYTQVTTYEQWIAGVVDGTIQSGDPDPGDPDVTSGVPIRVVDTDAPDDPVATAVAISELVFSDFASYGVLAASAKFPDALGGSALAYGIAPLLYADGAGKLPNATLNEFKRLLVPGDIVYILGGTAAIDASVDPVLEAAGFSPVRLAGANREETARLAAEKVLEVTSFGEAEESRVIVAYGYNWPDAVSAGQISAWFGIPVLLTNRDTLGADARRYLQEHDITEVFVFGGTAVVAEKVVTEIEAITGIGTTLRLAGENRLETGAFAALYNRLDLLPAEGIVDDAESIVVVNLYGDAAFGPVLAATMIPGAQTGVFAPIHAVLGAQVDQSVLDAICGLNVGIIAVGPEAQVPNASLGPIVQAATKGDNCTAG